MDFSFERLFFSLRDRFEMYIVIRYQTRIEKLNVFNCETNQINKITIMTHYTGASPIRDKVIKAITRPFKCMIARFESKEMKKILYICCVFVCV